MGCGGAATRGLTPAKVGGGLWHHKGGSLPRPHEDLRSAAGDRSSGNGRRSRGRRRGDTLRPERGQVPLGKRGIRRGRLRQRKGEAARAGAAWRPRLGAFEVRPGRRHPAIGQLWEGRRGRERRRGAKPRPEHRWQRKGAREMRGSRLPTLAIFDGGPLRLGGVRVGRLRVRGSACICPHYS